VTYCGRFAPSPSGPLHFGSLVAAVASFLDARAHGGRWLLRIEDVDAPRTVAGAETSILSALEAHGLEWDGPVLRQSDRTERYREALESLCRRGAVYRCRCSRREIEDSAIVGVEGRVYPGTCRSLRLGAEVEGADRFLVSQDAIAFDDRVLGTVEQSLARDIGDFVLRRRDGLFAYQLAVVVDDADQGITDVVRGADLLLSTPRQIALQRALGFATPRYMHVPAATNALGQKLSKQTCAPAVDSANASGSLRAALHFLGQGPAQGDTPREILANAAASWDDARIPRQRALEVTR
jgi:glutamyl-Q tRNA(Asp) synthetase